VSSFLRFAGIVNAAIWFGGGVFFAAVVLPAVFSNDVHQLLGVKPGEQYYTYYPGGIALVFFRRFFILQYICGALALLHLFAEKLYLNRSLSVIGAGMVGAILCLSLIGGIWLQPRMEEMRQTMYFGATAELREKAKHSFGVWHGISQTANLLVLLGTLTHMWRVTRPIESDRYSTFTIFRS
jgi:hypothetical protein